MIVGMHATKLVVRDVQAQEQFYLALGFKLVSRNLGGEAEVRQEQSWVSVSGDRDTHILILTRFLEVPPLPRPTYPGEVWLALMVADVDAVIARAVAAGGACMRAGEDRPEHAVRAA